MSCSNASSYTPDFGHCLDKSKQVREKSGFSSYLDKTPFGHNPAYISIKKLVLAFIWVWRFYAADCKNAGL